MWEAMEVTGILIGNGRCRDPLWFATPEEGIEIGEGHDSSEIHHGSARFL
jgi:hypothetical protein